jgi:ribosomal-protein-alanine N-acetyltransferase
MQRSQVKQLAKSTVDIRPIEINDELEYLENYRKNKNQLKLWVQVPKNGVEFREYVREMLTDENKAFVAFDKSTKKMCGIVELRDIYMFDFKNSYITYFGFAPNLKKGLMTQAVKLVIKVAFNQLKLHRLEANIQPRNLPSLALASACGFRREGYSPKFIKKNGRWKDHERWAILNRA